MAKKNPPFSFLPFLLVSLTLSAQAPEKHVATREQVWFGYVNQTRFTQHFGMWVDVQYRRTDHFIDRPFQFVFRPALTCFVKDNLRITVGYALARHYPAKDQTVTRTEHRIWQQFWWNQKYPGLAMLQWLRVEERYNEKVRADVKQGGYDYGLRIRYNLAFTIPLRGKQIDPQTFFVVAGNEIFLNLGGRIVYNTFDQNRFFAGIGYQFDRRMNAQLAYMNIYKQEASGNNYIATNSARLSVSHTLDLRSESESR